MRCKVLLSVASAAIGLNSVGCLADTSNMPVTATVLAVCKLNSTPTLAFGTLDPSSGVNVTQTATVSFWCSQGTSYSISPDNGLHYDGANTTRRMKGPGASDFIAYSLSPASATGTGAGTSTALNLAFSGTVQGSSYVNATVGSYSDTVVITITP